jgi:AcrR family transcriptional regulator
MSTKANILAAAREAFEEGGEAGLSVRDVAARVGLTPMAIYRHFKNREALLGALNREAIEDWRARVAAIAPCEPLEWLRAIGEEYLNFALRDPRRYEAAFLVSTKSALRYPDDFIAGGSPAVSLQFALIKDLIVSRGGPEVPVADILMMFVGLSQGLVSLYRAGRIAGGEKKFRTLYRRAMETCLRSFALRGHQ